MPSLLLAPATGLSLDGLSAYLKTFWEAFHSAHKGGKGGPPRLYVWQEAAIGRGIDPDAGVKRQASEAWTIGRLQIGSDGDFRYTISLTEIDQRDPACFSYPPEYLLPALL